GVVTTGAEAGGPVGDQWCGDATLVHPVLVLAERGVRHIRPGDTVRAVRRRPAGHQLGHVADPDPFAGTAVGAGVHGPGRVLVGPARGELLGTSTVVGQEDQQ